MLRNHVQNLTKNFLELMREHSVWISGQDDDTYFPRQDPKTSLKTKNPFFKTLGFVEQTGN